MEVSQPKVKKKCRLLTLFSCNFIQIEFPQMHRQENSHFFLIFSSRLSNKGNPSPNDSILSTNPTILPTFMSLVPTPISSPVFPSPSRQFSSHPTQRIIFIFPPYILYLTSMKPQIKRNRTDATAQDNFQSLKSHKKTHNVKTVAIFMDNLDKQIHQSYAKLRKNRQKMLSGKKESTLNEQTMPCATSSLLHGQQESHTHPCMYQSYRQNPSQLSPTSIDHQSIITLDNREVMEYIHLVYDIYNIKDPLQEQKETEIDKFYMTNKKIKTWKDNFQKSIGSASTMKHSHLHKSIELNPFSAGKAQTKKEHPSASKIELISLQSRLVSKEKQHSQSSGKSSTHRFQNTNGLSRKQKINITSSHRATTHSPAAVTSIPQLFRFCFMCEQPILECNLASHEKSCEALKQAYSKSFDELLRILDQKIAFLIEEINHMLIQKSQEKIKEEFALIKASVKSWMAKLPPDSLTKPQPQPQQNPYSKTWRLQFCKVEQRISLSVCSSFHLLHKLQWFSKLRENIALKYFPS